MQTKLSRYAEGMMEAAWLAAVVVIPVFFNIYSSRIFEPDKIAILRTFALLIIAGWFIKLFEVMGQQNIRGNLSTRIREIMRIPLVLPVFGLIIVYIFATIFSVTPGISLWGSYQRLQGTYTTFSYVVIFAAMLANLRKRAQVERLITAIIIASLPVSLYGVLQRFQIDPVPWGGDVSKRIAANLGNSIFLAAYLIMVFPLTVIRIVRAFETLLKDRGLDYQNFIQATLYVFIAALQLIAIYLTGSRGPWLGLGASIVFLWLGYSLFWRTRWLTFFGIVVSLIVGLLLVGLNIENGPLENLRSTPQFARIGHLLDAEGRTGRVRTLIWQGASELVKPHAALVYPDGQKDPMNKVRPFIGYGPESMYVAYNPFFPPELTQVEKRNASPDRSHNETWDSLVITGLLGLFIYILLFSSIIYSGLKWLFLIRSKQQRIFFWALYLGMGILTAGIFYFWKGVPFLGVALPFGMIVGVLVYLISISILSGFEIPNGALGSPRFYLILGLLAAIVAHFVEINFGIAIAVTRLYFWIYSSLLIIVGYLSSQGEVNILSQFKELDYLNDDLDLNSNPEKGSRRRERRVGRKTRDRGVSIWAHNAVINGLILSVLLVTLGFDLISNQHQANVVHEVLWDSLFRLGSERSTISLGVFVLFITTWTVGALIFASDSSSESDQPGKGFIKKLAVIMSISLFLLLFFALIHAGNLASLAKQTPTNSDQVLSQVKHAENLITPYILFVLLLVFLLGSWLPKIWPIRIMRRGGFSIAIGLFSVIAALVMANQSNLRVIQADVAFKTGETFSEQKNWPIAIKIFQRAIELAPNEDFYYLFLGRAYLESAKTMSDNNQREALFQNAESDLLQAQTINPLNTDHTANLARLHNLWSAFTIDEENKSFHALKSSDYYSSATSLSPFNARIWDEWAIVHLEALGQPERGFTILQEALTLDPLYDWTYGLLGEYYLQKVFKERETNGASFEQFTQEAIWHFEKALSFSDSLSTLITSGYARGLGKAHALSGNYEEAISAYELALQTIPDNMDYWRIFEELARVHLQFGEPGKSLFYAREAYNSAPDEQKNRLAEFLAQLGEIK